MFDIYIMKSIRLSALTAMYVAQKAISIMFMALLLALCASVLQVELDLALPTFRAMATSFAVILVAVISLRFYWQRS